MVPPKEHYPMRNPLIWVPVLTTIRALLGTGKKEVILKSAFASEDSEFITTLLHQVILEVEGVDEKTRRKIVEDYVPWQTLGEGYYRASASDPVWQQFIRTNEKQELYTLCMDINFRFSDHMLIHCLQGLDNGSQAITSDNDIYDDPSLLD